MRTQVITAKLKLLHSDEQARQFRFMTKSYADALNDVSHIVFHKLNKSSNNFTIQKATYSHSREVHELSSQLACSVCRVVAGTYKGLWTKLKSHKTHVINGHTKKRYKGLSKPPSYKMGCVELQETKDFSFSKNQIVSIITMNGRTKVPYVGWNKYIDLIQSGVSYGGAKLWLDKKANQWYLLVSLKIEAPEIEHDKITEIVGIDVGQRNIFVSTSNKNNTKFLNGRYVNHKINQYRKTKHELSVKGTRSAKRRLSAIGSRERRFKQNINHIASVDIIQNNTLIGMENLKYIQKNTLTKRRKGAFASKLQRKANYMHSHWAYNELYEFVKYKTIWVNSLVVLVNPYNTSKKCSNCKFVSNANRPSGSVLFKCMSCGYTIHSDKNASNNILNLTILERQCLFGMG